MVPTIPEATCGRAVVVYFDPAPRARLGIFPVLASTNNTVNEEAFQELFAQTIFEYTSQHPGP